MTAPSYDDPPYVDEHSLIVEAPPAAVWTALGTVLTQMSRSRRNRVGASLLGCADRTAAGDVPEAGSTIPGFHVAAARPGEELRLAGSHSFSRYRLTFCIDPVDGGRSRLRAITHAAFPGLGRAYGALVIGTGLHKVATRRLIRSIATAAESTTVR